LLPKKPPTCINNKGFVKYFNAQTRLFIVTLLMTAATAKAQTYANLYSFSGYSGFPPANSDGAVPYCGLILSSNVLYGTTWEGGTNGVGTIFSIHTDGTQFTNLHTFSKLSGAFYGYNSDGAQPYDTLVLSSNMLYGTAYEGGGASYGAVFRINTDGSGFTNLHSFTDGTGAPRAGLILSSNLLYGTTFFGGASYGAVFRMNIDGTGFANIHSFTSLTNDADNPAGGLVLSGNTLYGTAAGGGTLGGGVVFAVGANGKGYTNLFNFQPVGGESQSSTNTTGGTPYATLLLVGNTLYGTTPHGGTNGNGVIFAVHTDGSGFRNIHTFSASNNSTNSDGFDPLSQLILVGSNLYGTAVSGGEYGNGTVFAINTNGTGFTTVYDFPPIFSTNFVNLGGAGPSNGLLLSGSTLYGTTTLGGQADGTIYSLNLSPAPQPIPLQAQVSGGNLVLSWSTSAFSLQTAPTIGASFTNVTGATSPYTNTGYGSQQFFRLRAN
jgi:uncharacterized repeat protein (TIGR03803 family)